jgi:hypothetical protein
MRFLNGHLRLWKEVIVADFEVFSWPSTGKNKESHEILSG